MIYPCGCTRQRVELGFCDFYRPGAVPAGPSWLERLLGPRNYAIRFGALVAEELAADPTLRAQFHEETEHFELGEAGA